MQGFRCRSSKGQGCKRFCLFPALWICGLEVSVVLVLGGFVGWVLGLNFVVWVALVSRVSGCKDCNKH